MADSKILKFADRSKFQSLADAYHQPNLFDVVERVRRRVRQTIIDTLVLPGSNVIEVGAMHGDETARFARAVGPAGSVTCIECDPYALPQLRANVQLLRESSVSNVDIVERCAAAQPGLVDFFYDQAIRGHGVLNRFAIHETATTEFQEAIATTVDEIAEGKAIGFLSIDAQGGFFEILQGAKATLSVSRPPVLFEYMNLIQFGLTPDDVFQFFEDFGYEIFDFSGSWVGSPEEMGGLFWNKLAFPKDRPFPDAVISECISGRGELFPLRGLFLSDEIANGRKDNLEVVSLRSAAKLLDRPYRSVTLSHPRFNVGARQRMPQSETLGLTSFPKAGVVIYQRKSGIILWKVMPRDHLSSSPHESSGPEGNLWIEEVGHTTSQVIYGLDHWIVQDGTITINIVNPFCTGLPDGLFLLGGEVNYWHWLTNWLPRMMAFDYFRDELPDIGSAKILASASLSPAQKESLYLLGVQPENLVLASHSFNYDLRDVFVSTVCGNSLLSRNSAEWIRSKYVLPGERPRRRIYISRNDIPVARRRVANDAEVVRCLQNYGFESVTLTGRSFREQVDLFSDAEIVVAPNGAGMANLVFAPPKCRVIVIENSWRHDWVVDFVHEIGGEAEIFAAQDVIDEAYENRLAGDPDAQYEARRNRDMIVDIDLLREVVAGNLKRLV